MKPKKFKSAEEKRRYYELQDSWEKLKRKYDGKTPPKSVSSRSVSDVYVPERFVVPRGESGTYRSHGDFTGVATKPLTQKVYTGTKMIGIGVLHKSNSVPIFSDEEAIDISKMRRG